MSSRTTCLYYKSAIAVLALLLGGMAARCALPWTDDPPETTAAYSCMEVPRQITFCNEQIDLTRFDRRERMDRELLAMTYMHSNSLQIIKRANRYLPVIERLLADNGVPDDLKYLMVIESSLNPLALSAVGAAGLWQFMPDTGREFGLTVNSHVDERYHIEQATRAACRYLKQAYAKYGNWLSVAAAYNGGQGRISKEHARQYEDEALDLHLTEETARYIYRILAAKLLLTDPRPFGFRLRASDLYAPIPFREITVGSTIEDLPRFAKSQGTTYALLRQLNPWIRGRSLPVQGKTGYVLRIPDPEGMHYNPKVIIPHHPQWVTEEP